LGPVLCQTHSDISGTVFGQTHNDITGPIIGQTSSRKAIRLGPRLESESCLSCSLATATHTTSKARPQTQKCPGSDAGAFDADDAILLTSDSVQPSLALFMLGKDNVDLRVGRDRNDYPAGRVQTHQLRVARVADVLRHSLTQKVTL